MIHPSYTSARWGVLISFSEENFLNSESGTPNEISLSSCAANCGMIPLQCLGRGFGFRHDCASRWKGLCRLLCGGVGRLFFGGRSGRRRQRLGIARNMMVGGLGFEDWRSQSPLYHDELLGA